MSDNEQNEENRETVAEILEEMRGMGNYQRYSGDHARALADRIDAAWKRDRAKVEADALEVGGIVEAARTAEKSSAVGNAAAMRDALVQCELFLGKVSRDGGPMFCFGDQCTACNGADELRGMVVRAISAPARNCDFGTAEEQTKRFSDFCSEHRHTDLPRCAGCPLENVPSDTGCSFAWAQMPYEAERKGEADGR